MAAPKLVTRDTPLTMPLDHWEAIDAFCDHKAGGDPDQQAAAVQQFLSEVLCRYVDVMLVQEIQKTFGS